METILSLAPWHGGLRLVLSLLDTQSQKVSYQITRLLWCWKMTFQLWRISVTLYTRASWKNSSSKLLRITKLLLLWLYNHTRLITRKLSKMSDLSRTNFLVHLFMSHNKSILWQTGFCGLVSTFIFLWLLFKIVSLQFKS